MVPERFAGNNAEKRESRKTGQCLEKEDSVPFNRISAAPGRGGADYRDGPPTDRLSVGRVAGTHYHGRETTVRRNPFPLDRSHAGSAEGFAGEAPAAAITKKGRGGAGSIPKERPSLPYGRGGLKRGVWRSFSLDISFVCIGKYKQ